MRPKDHRAEMLLLASTCQRIVEDMLCLLEGEREPDPKRIQEAALLMIPKERLRNLHHGLVWNKVFQWKIREYRKPLPRIIDFRLVLRPGAAPKSRKAAAERILEFFSAISTQALWYFEQPPDFDSIIAREVMRDFGSIDRTAQKSTHPRKTVTH